MNLRLTVHRLWWSAYIIDRHSSFSFNLRPVFADAECRNLGRPCPDSVWESDMLLSESVDNRMWHQGVDYEVHTLDFMGIVIPLFA